MKGQSSMEFLSMVSLSMILLASLYSVMVSKQQNTFDYRQERTAEMVGDQVSFEVEMALVQGEGYSRIFSLPGGIGGSEYNVTVGQGEILVKWKTGSLYQLSRYQGEKMKIVVDDSSQVFKVVHNESGVFIDES